MKFFITTLSLVCLFILSSCAHKEQQQKQIEDKWVKDKWIQEFVDGWDEMITHLNDYTKSPATLKGKKFNLKIKLDGEWKLFVFPVTAFQVKRTGEENKFEAEIIDPTKLFENSGGLSRLTYIQAELKKIGGAKGTIDLTPEVSCLFKIKFKQKNGSTVNFDRLLERYEYEFVISPSKDVEIYSVTPDYLTLKRVGNMTGDAFLRLLLVDKKTKETLYSNEVNIPECGYGNVLSEKPDKRKYFIIKEAGQCIKHIKTYGQPVDDTKVHKVFHQEEFYNMCNSPVKCKLTAKYGYVKDKKILDADTRVYDFSIGPREIYKVDTSWNYINQKFDFDAKVYIATKASKTSLPKGYKNEDMPGFLECIFE